MADLRETSPERLNAPKVAIRVLNLPKEQAAPAASTLEEEQDELANDDRSRPRRSKLRSVSGSGLATMIRIALGAIAISLAGGLVTADADDPSVGRVHFPISCSDEQAPFDRGVALLSNFAYDGTVKAFQAIAARNPDCAIAYWGIAMSDMANPLSPPFPPGNLEDGWAAIQKGKAAKTQSPREGEYLGAIETLYRDYATLDYRTRALRYEQAMQKLHENYPDDAEAAIFYALALNMAIDLTDRGYHKQLKAASILSKVADAEPENPGAFHFLIHSLDYPPLAALALPAARRYGTLASGSVHALHMPSHIYSMLGMWQDSIQSNLAARAAFEGGAGKDFNPVWEAHLFDFLECAYLQLGQDVEAKRILDRLPEPSRKSFVPLTIDTALSAIPARYALERGDWTLAANLPVGDSVYAAAQSITYFARALGAARVGDLAEARTGLAHLDAIEGQLAAAHDDYWAGQTRVQREAVRAWIMLADGQPDAAIAVMRTAADLDDASDKTVAMENKLVPMRALLAELYLATDRSREALGEFRASQKAFPNRFRTLAGAAMAAEAVGLVDQARAYYAALLELTKSADAQRPQIAAANSFLVQHPGRD